MSGDTAEPTDARTAAPADVLARAAPRRRWPQRSALLSAATVATLLWGCLLVLVLAGLTDTTDARLLDRLTVGAGSAEAEVARVVTDLGSGSALVLLLPVLALPFLALRGARLRLVVAPVAAIGVASAVVNVTKVAVGRERPPEAGRLVETSTMSFPSGHSASAAAGLVTFALLAVAVTRTAGGRAAVVTLAGAGVAAVGWTRTALAVHWPADVLGGWALGTAVACFAVLVARMIGARPPGARPRRVRARAGPAPPG